MALTFKNVTDIHTAWGNLTKIQDAATGAVLWQKKSAVPTPAPDPDPAVVEDGYPKLIPVLNNQYADAAYIANSKYMDTVAVGSDIYKTGYTRRAYVGNTFSFPYVNNKDEEKNVFTKGHTAVVEYGISKIAYTVALENGAPQSWQSKIELPGFFAMEKAGENSSIITSIKDASEYGSYLSALNAAYPETADYPHASFPKSTYPYFCFRMRLFYYSASLGISYDADRFIAFFYHIPR